MILIYKILNTKNSLNYYSSPLLQDQPIFSLNPQQFSLLPQDHSQLKHNIIKQQFQMNSEKVFLDQQETGIGSPNKNIHNHQPIEEIPPNSISLAQTQIQKPMSLTEHNLNSREIVKNLIQKTKNTTIKHQINSVDKDSRLYARPARYNPTEFRFNNIPPQNSLYSSSCSAKIKQINKALQNRPTNIQHNRYQNAETIQRSQILPQKGQQRISVSGLITCNFQSVNAQRSLGYNQINYEQIMKQEIKKSQKMSLCSHNRFKNILLKANHHRYKQETRKQQSILSNFQTTTSEYLQQRIHQQQQQMFIFGQKAKKLNFIKDYMVSEKNDYEEGRHIINQIQKRQPKQKHKPHLHHCKTEIDEDKLIRDRKIPTKHKRIKIRFLTFQD